MLRLNYLKSFLFDFGHILRNLHIFPVCEIFIHNNLFKDQIKSPNKHFFSDFLIVMFMLRMQTYNY